MRIWTNVKLPPEEQTQLQHAVQNHTLLQSPTLNASVLTPGQSDPALLTADVALGQPPIPDVLNSNLKWMHLTTAGYERWDTPEIKATLKQKQILVTNSSHVYDEPCAQHLLALILANARQLPQAFQNQRTTKQWPQADVRSDSRLTQSQSLLLLGFGAIAQRLTQLLTPLQMNLSTIRQTPTGTEPIPAYPLSQLESRLPHADHVVNILPGGPQTKNFFNQQRLSLLKPTAIFYNIGRGTTVDQTALIHQLNTSNLAAAYLDVTDPEPLPPTHPLWTTPNLFITPHTAGGHHNELQRLIHHFAANLSRFEQNKPLKGQIL